MKRFVIISGGTKLPRKIFKGLKKLFCFAEIYVKSLINIYNKFELVHVIPSEQVFKYS